MNPTGVQKKDPSPSSILVTFMYCPKPGPFFAFSK
jgi:hypothetical protein